MAPSLPRPICSAVATWEVFAPGLAFAGFHHLVITGKAEKPVYLYINNDEFEIRDASSIRVKDTFETQKVT